CFFGGLPLRLGLCPGSLFRGQSFLFFAQLAFFFQGDLARGLCLGGCFGAGLGLGEGLRLLLGHGACFGQGRFLCAVVRGRGLWLRLGFWFRLWRGFRLWLRLGFRRGLFDRRRGFGHGPFRPELDLDRPGIVGCRV